MKSVKMKGTSVEEAIEAALAVLGAKRKEVDIKIISEGKKSLLGVIGGEEAEVEVFLKSSLSEEAKGILQDILDKMGFMSLVNAEKEEEDSVFLNIRGEDMGRIIGKEGAALNAFQILVSTILSNKHGRRIRASIDAGDYRLKKEAKLKKMAEEAASSVIATGKETELPPMPGADRRIIHITLKENPKVISFSRGVEAGRRVVVAPKEKEEEILKKEEGKGE